jgi:hypothetical protein
MIASISRALRIFSVVFVLTTNAICVMAQAPASAPIMQRVDSSQAPQSNTAAVSFTSSDQKRAVYSLDEDLISFAKVAVWTGGGFLTVFALLAVGFFGIDVRAAHKSIRTATDDIKQRIDALKKEHQEAMDLKDRLEKLGAALVEEYEKSKFTIPTPPVSSASAPLSTAADPPGDMEPEREVLEDLSMVEAKMATVRRVISTSKFEWTSLDRLERLTKMPRAELLHLTESDSMVRRSVGVDGKPIFKLKKAVFKFVDPSTAPSYLIDESVLMEHAAKGKEPLSRGSIFGSA